MHLFSNNDIAVNNKTFVGNVATDMALGERLVIEAYSFESVEMNNNIFFENSLDGDADAYDLRARAKDNGEDYNTSQHSNVLQRMAGLPALEEGTIGEDPAMIDPANGDFRLADGSPAIDAGREAPLGGVGETDAAGGACREGVSLLGPWNGAAEPIGVSLVVSNRAHEQRAIRYCRHALLATLFWAVGAPAAELFADGFEHDLPKIASFTSNRDTLGNGDTAHLSWEVSGATELELLPSSGSIFPQSGGVDVAPIRTTEYTLTARNAAGSVSRRLRIDRIVLDPLAADLYRTEHALFLIGDPTSFPSWDRIYDAAAMEGYVARLNAVVADDWLLVVVTAAGLTPDLVPMVEPRRYIADGIGLDSTTGVGIPNLCRYNLGHGTVLDSALAVFDHEIAHNWGARIADELSPAWHWLENTTVHGQLAETRSYDGFITVREIDGDPQTGFTWRDLDNLARNEEELYALQDLYSMGLEPAFATAWRIDDPVFDADGTVRYSSAVAVDHSAIVARHGARVPDFRSSPKRFRIAFVHVARDLAEIEATYRPLERSIRQFTEAEVIDRGNYRFQVPFLVATRFRASVDARLADLDGNAAPTLDLPGGGYLFAATGNGEVAIAASDAEDGMPTVTLLTPNPALTVAGDRLLINGLPSGAHFLTLKAVDTLGKKAFAHLVVEVP